MYFLPTNYLHRFRTKKKITHIMAWIPGRFERLFFKPGKVRKLRKPINKNPNVNAAQTMQ